MAGELKVQLRQISLSASEASIGTHRVPIDRPAAKGGADAGPMGGELFLAAIGGCFMSNLLAAIAARESEITGVDLEVTGRLHGSPARFAAIDIYVSAKSAGGGEALQKLVDIADRGCIMMNTLRGTLDLTVRTGG